MFVGLGGLSLSIEGASKADIECSDSGDGRCCVTYHPTAPGLYVINIFFADQPIQGTSDCLSVCMYVCLSVCLSVCLVNMCICTLCKMFVKMIDIVIIPGESDDLVIVPGK